jgi:hypothetical protein
MSHCSPQIYKTINKIRLGTVVVILATPEEEIRRIQVQGQPRKKFLSPCLNK